MPSVQRYCIDGNADGQQMVRGQGDRRPVMDHQAQWQRLPGVREAAAAGHYGTILRLARSARNLTLAEAGALCGYSASTLSRYETGRKQLTDVIALRRLAAALSIPPELSGLAVADA